MHAVGLDLLPSLPPSTGQVSDAATHLPGVRVLCVSHLQNSIYLHIVRVEQILIRLQQQRVKREVKFKVIPGLNRWRARVNSCGTSVPRMLLAVRSTPSALDAGT